MATMDELHEMIEKDDYNKLKKEIKIDPHIPFLVNSNGSSLLTACAIHDSYECMVVLVQAGVDLNKRANQAGDTALILAILCNCLQVARYLLQQGAKISSRDVRGISAFNWAILQDQHSGNDEWFKLFEPFKENFDEQDMLQYKEHRLSVLFALNLTVKIDTQINLSRISRMIIKPIPL